MLARRRRGSSWSSSAIGALAVSRLGGSTPTSALAAPHFVDETAAAGIDHTYDGGLRVRRPVAASRSSTATATGGRTCIFAGGSSPAALYRNDSPVGGALRFTPLPDPVTDLTGVNGAYPIDIDGDGNVDLAVLRVGGSDAAARPRRLPVRAANERWGFDGGDRPGRPAFSATWEGVGGLPTLAVGRLPQARCDGRRRPWTATTTSSSGPTAGGTGYAPADRRWRPGYCALSMLFSDWDRSGRRDLRVSNDRHYYDQVDGEEQLWRVAAGEPPRLYTDADGWVRDPDLGHGHRQLRRDRRRLPRRVPDQPGRQQAPDAEPGPDKPTYRDIGLKRGVNAAAAVHRRRRRCPSTAWHPEFQDVNNDGFVDLFISKGNVSDDARLRAEGPEQPAPRPAGRHVRGGRRWTPGSSTSTAVAVRALVDFNLDGLLDLVEVDYGSPVKVWRNVGSGDAAKPAPMGGWLALQVSPAGPEPRCDRGVGRGQGRRHDAASRDHVGGGHSGASSAGSHFGLGPAEAAQVRVQWPDGEWGPWLDVKADGFYELERGATVASPWRPPGP